MIQTDELISLHSLVDAQIENPSSSFFRTLKDTISEHETADFERRIKPLYKTKNRFVLTSAATKMCAIMANKDPDLIIRMLDEATAPTYPTPIWVEWDKMDQLGHPPDDAQDKMAGFIAWKEFSTGDGVNAVHWGSVDLVGAGCSIAGMILWPKSGIDWKPALGTGEENIAIDRLDTERARLMGWNWIAAQQQAGADIRSLASRATWSVGSMTGFSFGRVVAKSYKHRMDKASIEDSFRAAMDAADGDMRMTTAVLALKHRGVLVEKKPKPVPQHHEKAGRIVAEYTLLDVRRVHEE